MDQVTVPRAVAQQALEALGKWSSGHDMDAVELNDLIATLEAALEQFAHPPRRDPLTVTELQQALVDADLVDPDAIDDPEGFDNGFTLQQIDALHSRLMQTTPPTTPPPPPK
jgi:hypothetical protein